MKYNNIRSKIEYFITNIFWVNRTIVHFFLLPLSFLYLIALSFYKLLHKEKRLISGCKVICVGNITVGGNGKTPIAISIAEFFINSGKSPKEIAFISKGYNGTITADKDNVIKVDLNEHNAEQVGDEALLLAALAPTYISHSRYKALEYAHSMGSKIAIIDDGFQDHSINKDHSIIVINSSIGLGNNLTLPIGPLRESIHNALIKANSIIFLENGNNNPNNNCNLTSKNEIIRAIKKLNLIDKINILDAKIIVSNKQEIEDLAISSRAVIGLVSIAYPDKFINTAKNSGIKFMAIYKFPDHWNYSVSELDKIYFSARKNKAIVLTTAKDFVKIPDKYHSNTVKLDIEAKVDLRFLSSYL